MTGILVAGASWRRGYAILALAQTALAACFVATRARWPRGGVAMVRDRAAAPAGAPLVATLRLRAARLGIVSFCLYVGLEATAGAWIYSLLRDQRGLAVADAGTAVTIYWGGLLVGRLVFGLVPERRHPRQLPLLAAAAAAASAVWVALARSGASNLAAVAVLGAACGPVFPSLIAATSRRLGEAHAANGVGVQIAAAAIGQSLLPSLAGVAARRTSLEILPWILAFTAVALCAILGALDRTAAPPLESTRIQRDRATSDSRSIFDSSTGPSSRS
jgi:fucose permease